MHSQLFFPTLKRSEILSLSKTLNFTHTRHFKFNIHRNHAFEPIQSVIAPFLHYSNIQAEYIYSDYDDSLNFTNSGADLEIIFLDLHRYKLQSENLEAFLLDRALALRALSNAPILLLTLDSKDTNRQYLESSLNPKNLAPHNIFALSLNALYAQHSELTQSTKPLLDEIKESITGTKLSNTACLALARILGLRYIPSLLLPNLKAIVLDLDNTLYQGVLGEDPWESLLLTPAHKALQEQILAYKKQGYLLAVASKNEEQDAREMFNFRSDFPLQWSDFDCTLVNWQSKAQNLAKIAQHFNIGLDSMLFIDDNIAEIESTRHTGVQQIHAQNVKHTLLSFYLYPRLYKFQTNKEDSLRSADISANAQRQSLQVLSDEEYFSNLSIELDFRVNHTNDAQRIYELMNKTNQFIANYTRPTPAKIQEWLEDPHHCVITISMRDRLSDSGIIGIVVGSCENGALHIQDICISCRALGRRLESTLLLYSFTLCAEYLQLPNAQSALVSFQKGDRNAPFLNTLQNLLNTENISSPAEISLTHNIPKGLSILISKESVCQSNN